MINYDYFIFQYHKIVQITMIIQFYFDQFIIIILLFDWKNILFKIFKKIKVIYFYYNLINLFIILIIHQILFKIY